MKRIVLFIILMAPFASSYASQAINICCIEATITKKEFLAGQTYSYTFMVTNDFPGNEVIYFHKSQVITQNVLGSKEVGAQVKLNASLRILGNANTGQVNISIRKLTFAQSNEVQQ